MRKRRVTVVTAGHLSTCPRMLKAADAFHAAGYKVRVVSTCNTAWAAEADRALQANRQWRWNVVDYTRDGNPGRWFVSGLRVRATVGLSTLLGDAVPLAVAQAAFARVHAELVGEILREPQDFIYGGTTGGIGAVVEAAERAGVPGAVDFEDFHCAEHAPGGGGAMTNQLADRIMRRCTARAAFVTAGSAAIAHACEERFGTPAIAISNVFPLPREAASARMSGPLRVYWFSQTIGAGRGIEDIIDAAGQAAVPCELHLRGVGVPGYVDGLHVRAAATAPRLQLVVHPPESPDAMVEACRRFDVGVSPEQIDVPNRRLTLPNKVLTYPLAPLAVAMTNTPGHQPLASDLNGHAIVYAPGSTGVLAEGLARWASDERALQDAKDATWDAARRRWHWEHPLERDTLLAAVERVLS